MAHKKGRLRLSSYLGDRLHKALKLCLYEQRTHRQGSPYDWVHVQLDNHFGALRKMIGNSNKPVTLKSECGQQYWSEDDVRHWVIGCLKSFYSFVAKEQITWYREDWSLEMTHLNRDGSRQAHLGTPDFPAYGNKRNRWFVLDFKNAASSDRYIDTDSHDDLYNSDKALGYVFGVAQKLRREEKRQITFPVIYGYMVFIREKVAKGKKAKLKLITYKAKQNHLSRWLNERLKQPRKPSD